MNTVLANAQAEGRIPGSMYDVLYLENEAGYVLGNLNPTTEGFYFAWDQKQNKILFIESNLETVRFPDDYTLDPTTCWITCATTDEMIAVSEKNFNIYLENDIDAKGIQLTNVVSIDTGAFTLSNLEINSTSSTPVEAWLIGNFAGGDSSVSASSSGVTINAPNAIINTRGVISSLSMSGNNAVVNISGTVSNFAGQSGVNANVQGSGLVNSITGASNVVNNGVVLKNQTSGSTTGSGSSVIAGNKLTVASKEEIEAVRLQVATGSRNFKDETIELSGDINMNGIAFQPISSYYRKPSEDIVKGASYDAWFQGTLDGKNYEIKNLSNHGFAISGLTAGTNSTSVHFGVTNIEYSEAIYGLFASVYNATIKNITISCDIDMTIDSANHYVGDSVGGIVGFASGDYLIMENCHVSGSVKGYDGVGGLVGRSYALVNTFTKCTNNANVTGVRHTGGIIGYVSGSYKDYAQNEDGQWVILKDGTQNKVENYTVENGVRKYISSAVKKVVEKETDATALATHYQTINMNEVVNNGMITCLGLSEDINLGARKSVTYYKTADGTLTTSSKTSGKNNTKLPAESILISKYNDRNGVGYYVAGAAFSGQDYNDAYTKYVSGTEVNDGGGCNYDSSKNTFGTRDHYTLSKDGFTNNGKVYIGESEVTFVTMSADYTNQYTSKDSSLAAGFKDKNNITLHTSQVAPNLDFVSSYKGSKVDP